MNYMHIWLMSKFFKYQLVTMLLALASLPVAAQRHQGFNPAKFKADLEKFITVEACLTPREAAAFFPLYDELNNKQRVLYDKIRELRRIKPSDEERCKKAIAEIDQLEIEIKQLQSNYHTRFLAILPASKLFDVIRAENKFHRQAMRNAANPWQR